MRNRSKRSKIYKRKTYKGGSFPGYPGYPQSQPEGYIENGLFIAYTPAQRYQMYLEQMRLEQMRLEQMRIEQMQQMQMFSMGYGMPMGGYGMPMAGYGMPMPGYGMPMPGYGMPMPGYGMPMPGYAQASIQAPAPAPVQAPVYAQVSPASAPPASALSVHAPSFQFSPSAGAFVPLSKNSHSSHSPKGKTLKSPGSRSPGSKSPKSPKGSRRSKTPEPLSPQASIASGAGAAVSGAAASAENDPPIPPSLTKQLTNSYILYDELLNNLNYRGIMTSAMRKLTDYDLGPTNVFLRQNHKYGVFRVDKKEDNDIYFNWDEVVNDELVQRCHISLHNSTTDKAVNKSAGSLHVKIDKDGTSKRICIFLVGREFHIAIKDEQMDPMIYTPLDRFAADVVGVLLEYYETSGRTAMKIDTSFCVDPKPPESGKGKGKGKGKGFGKGKGI